MKVSIFDVAKKAGLSVVTVSRVLNNATTVREKNRLKVLQAMKELDYRPNAAARSLAKGKTGVIGLIIATLQDSFLDSIVQHASRQLKEHGYYLALSVANYPLDEGDGLELIQEDRVDGVLILSAVHEDLYVMELKKRKIPYVLIDSQSMQPSALSVQVDHYKGGYEATQHLIQMGHKRIAHMRGPHFFLSAAERERGYRDAVKEAGLETIYMGHGDFTIPSGYQLMKKWIESQELPDALFAADDYMAIGAINALQEAGYQVPDHISIVGYDDQVLATQLRPQLSTVKQPSERIACSAVEILIKQMNGTMKRQPSLKFEPELVVRATSLPRAAEYEGRSACLPPSSLPGSVL